ARRLVTQVHRVGKACVPESIAQGSCRSVVSAAKSPGAVQNGDTGRPVVSVRRGIRGDSPAVVRRSPLQADSLGTVGTFACARLYQATTRPQPRFTKPARLGVAPDYAI